MKKMLVLLSILFFSFAVDAQVTYVPVDTTAHLLRKAIDHMHENEYGIKRIDLGWWDEYEVHYWLIHDTDGYILYKMGVGDTDLVSATLLPKADGHGFMVHSKSKKTAYLLKEVSKILYERNIIPATEFDEFSLNIIPPFKKSNVWVSLSFVPQFCV